MPSFEFEDNYDGIVAGVDEAGRGPWAGPVVAGAVVFLNRKVDDFLLDNLNDSKKISAKKREILYEKLILEKYNGNILAEVGVASADEIDRMNILQATFLAMKRAVNALEKTVNVAIVDGNQIPKTLDCKCVTLVKGDAKSYSVAAASIMAKVTRDRYMRDLAQKYPYFGFEKNAGYGTKDHIEGLKKYGIIKNEHRISYKPVAEILSNTKN